MHKFLALLISFSFSFLTFAGQNNHTAARDTSINKEDPGNGRVDYSVRGAAAGAGYLFMAEAVYGIGVGMYKIDFIKLSVINGYSFSPCFSLGLGAGLKLYYNDHDLVIPLFIDARLKFTHSKAAPYLSLGIGSSVDITSYFTVEDVDFLINPAAGVSFRIADKAAVHVGMGYEMQSMRFYNDLNQTASTENSGCISLHAGISF